MALTLQNEDGTIEWIKSAASSIRELKTLQAGRPHSGSTSTFRILSITNISTGQPATNEGIPLATSVYCPSPSAALVGPESGLISAAIGLTSVSELDRLIDRCLTRLYVGESCEFTINCCRSKISLIITIQLVSIEDSTELFELDNQKIYESASKLKEEGVKLFSDGFPIDAFSKFSQALKYFYLQHPTAWEPSHNALISTIKSNMASCHVKAGNWMEAIDLSSLVLETDSDNIKALYRRGLSYIETQEFEKAKNDLLRAKEIDPGNQAVKNMLEILNKKQKALDTKCADAMKKYFS